MQAIKHYKKTACPRGQAVVFKGGAVSRVLFLNLPFIWRNLPPGIGRAALICQYIWSCKSQWRTQCISLYTVVSSCLAFSPLPLRAVVFCYGLLKITPHCAFHSRVPCPARTFLTPPEAERDRSSHLKSGLQRYKFFPIPATSPEKHHLTGKKPLAPKPLILNDFLVVGCNFFCTP